MLGGALAGELLRANHSVIGLVHRAAEIRDNTGQLLHAEDFGVSGHTAARLSVLKGDVTKPSLGFDDATLAALESSVDAVIHCAAMVRFEAPIEDLAEVNVQGTLNTARLCPGARFIHVSTAYVCGAVNGPVAEAAADTGARFANGYEQSKALAEAELLRVRPDAIIARPSIVVGEQVTGRIRSFDTIYRAFKFVAEGRIATVPVGEGATLNFVPIDYVVSGIVDLVEAGAGGPRFLHLAARHAIAARRFLAVIGTLPGLRAPDIVEPSGGDAATQGFAERLAAPYWSYFDRSPQFEVSALEHLTGRAAPVMDEEAFRRQIAFCVEAGFIKPRG